MKKFRLFCSHSCIIDEDLMISGLVLRKIVAFMLFLSQDLLGIFYFLIEYFL